MRIDVIHVNDEPRISYIRGERRIKTMFCGNAVEPNGRVAGADFTMDRPPLGGSVDASRNEPERLNEEIMRRWNVLVRQNRDYSIEGRHRFPLSVRHINDVALSREPRGNATSIWLFVSRGSSAAAPWEPALWSLPASPGGVPGCR